ncbi:hypothetical protein DW998_13335 [Parabacteroides distasonis]|nr:hypothetical protein DW998_13335 [Parabacteroides distasonis]
MVAKISHGMSLYGALAYNYEKVAAGTAEILSGNRMISDRLGLPSEDIRLALLSFENYLLANRNTEKPVLHISLSPAPEDRLTDGRLAELAERYMQKMGYGNQPYITYKHADTHNTHIHIVSVCVNEQGKKISDAYEYRRSMTACRELEVDFGLRNGADAERRNPKAELRKVDASLGDVRHQIGNTLKAVLESYRFQTFGEYNALLSTLNIEAKQVRGEYNGTPYTGIVYSVTDDTGKVVSPPFKSSRFGKRFGNEQLEKRMLMAALGLYNSRIVKLINKKKQLKCAVIIDELPTIYFRGLDNLIATARSNKVGVLLGFQDFSQLTRDYGEKESKVIQNTVGNIFSGQVVGETAKTLSERFGKVLQQRQSVSINRQDVSTSINTQLDSLIPASKIANLSQGTFVGAVADNFDERIEQKIFHAEIVVDHTKISAEEKAYQKIPVINDFKDRNGNDIMMQQIQRNYDQIKADAQVIINEEMRRIKNDPELRKRLGLEDEKGKDPDKS